MRPLTHAIALLRPIAAAPLQLLQIAEVRKDLPGTSIEFTITNPIDLHQCGALRFTRPRVPQGYALAPSCPMIQWLNGMLK